MLGNLTALCAKYAPFGQSVSLHALRHAHATHCFEAGIDIFALKKLLGHTYLTTTEVYVNPNFTHHRKVYEQTGLMGLNEQNISSLRAVPKRIQRFYAPLHIMVSDGPRKSHLLSSR